jgi:CheY-like chemotaxis protein
VLLNLYVNAWQAMPGGGELYIGTENVRVQEDFIKAFQARRGRYVKISVTDTGVGMDKETRAKIFDPFFTTKEMGRGTGLGLASVYGIVKNHEGIIDVQSKKGEGTTFHIYLPASHRALTGEGDSLEELVGGEEGVLLVDDEEMIIDVGKKMLEKLGYEVTLARSGVEALEVYKEHRDRIELVILDLIMPEMDGGDTYDQLKAIDPSVKVLLSSGYSMDGHAQEVLARGCQGFIQKPFDLRDLSRLVRRVLDSESSSDAP